VNVRTAQPPIETCYLWEAFDLVGRAELRSRIERALLPHRHKFDALIATGASGLLMASVLSDRFDIPLAVARKPGEGSHAQLDIEGANVSRYLMVDDFVAGGGTVQRVYHTALRHGRAVVGILLYRDRLLRFSSTLDHLRHCGPIPPRATIAALGEEHRIR
jgi:adenine/guanine phosphoribosyltransferase-like PRPP-binding protein